MHQARTDTHPANSVVELKVAGKGEGQFEGRRAVLTVVAAVRGVQRAVALPCLAALAAHRGFHPRHSTPQR
jgi:hypothetical protein